MSSTLRYYPSGLVSDNHYTAIVHKNQVVEVKRAGETVKRVWDTVEEWLASLPNQPTMDQIVMEKAEKKEKKVAKVMEEKEEKEMVKKEEKEMAKMAKKAEKEEKEMAKKAEKEKKEKLVLRLIPVRDQIPATHWTLHLHRMIKEACPALLKDPKVVMAFNHLVETLLEHREHVHGYLSTSTGGYLSTSTGKYESGVDLDANPIACPLKGMCTVRRNSVFYHEESGRAVIRSKYYYTSATAEEKKEDQIIIQKIVEAYRPLYEMIRDSVVPYMTKMVQEKKEKERQKRIRVLVERMEREETLYESERKRREASLITLDSAHKELMNRLREQIATL